MCKQNCLRNRPTTEVKAYLRSLFDDGQLPGKTKKTPELASKMVREQFPNPSVWLNSDQIKRFFSRCANELQNPKEEKTEKTKIKPKPKPKSEGKKKRTKSPKPGPSSKLDLELESESESGSSSED